MCLQVRDLTSLQYMMDNLRDCRENESKHSTQIRKLIASFDLLTRYLPEGVMSADELDCTNVLETTYKKLSDHCEDASQDVANMQAGFKKGLLKDVVDFQGDMKRFRDEWLTKVCERGCYFFWGGSFISLSHCCILGKRLCLSPSLLLSLFLLKLHCTHLWQF